MAGIRTAINGLLVPVVGRLPHRAVLKVCELYLRSNTGRHLAQDLLRLEFHLALAEDHRRRVAALIGNGRVHYFDIGARRGPPGYLRPYAQWMDFTLCEPEPKEAARLRAMGYTVVEQAIADVKGTATLHVTRSPGSSSLLHPLGRMRRFGTTDLSKVDILEEVAVETTTIDHVAKELGIGFHFVKLDTQGSEPDIIKGMTACRPLLIATEVSFEQIYRDQATFYQFSSEIVSRGYLLFQLHVPPVVRSPRTSRERSLGIPLHGDAFFMPNWNTALGRELICADVRAYAALMLIHGLEDVLRFVLSEIPVPGSEDVRSCLAMAARAGAPTAGGG